MHKQLSRNATEVTKGLTVVGPINGKDLIAIYKLPNLKSLDLSNAYFLEHYAVSFEGEQYYYPTYDFYLPLSKTFDTLKIPQKCFRILPEREKREKTVNELWLPIGLSNFESISKLTSSLHFYNSNTINNGLKDDNDSIGIGLLQVATAHDKNEQIYLIKNHEPKGSDRSTDVHTRIYDYPTFLYVGVPNRVALLDPAFSKIHALNVIVEDEKDTIVVHYPFDFSDHDSIGTILRPLTLAPYAFCLNTGFYGINMNNKISEIPLGCFYCCFNLRQVNLTGVKKIGAYAFSNTNIKKVVIPASVQELDCSAFLYSALDTIDFIGENPPKITNWDQLYNKRKDEWDLTTANSPHWDDAIGKQWKRMTIIVPGDKWQNYNKGFWKELGVIIEGANVEHEITITEPGTLALQIDNEMLRTARNITLKGILYDTDIQYLNKCKNLRTLDLSMCLVLKSPKTFQNEMDEMQSMLNLYKVIGNMAVENAEHEYQVGKMNLGDAMYSTIVGEYLKLLSNMISSNEIKANKSCISPKIEIKTLRNYKMPLQATSISGFSQLPELSNIELPPDASYIERAAFAGCLNLLHVKIPQSVSHLGIGAFDNCGLVEIDLSETSIEEYDGYLNGFGYYDMFDRRCEFHCEQDCPNLKIVRLPKRAYKWYGPITYGSELYIYTPDPPKGINLKRQNDIKAPRTIHVPQGSKLNYASIVSANTTVVDDIEVAPDVLFTPDPNEELLCLYSKDGLKLYTFTKGKIFLGDISDSLIVAEIRDDKFYLAGDAYGIYKGLALYAIEGFEVGRLDGNVVSFGDNSSFIIDGKKICNSKTGKAFAIFNKTPNVKVLLAALILSKMLSKASW